MTARSDPLMLALDGVDVPVRFFVRDDDAGWDDTRLAALLDVAADCDVPIDLAVIPAVLGDALAERLLRRRRLQPLGLHQHGWAHANHEPSGRRCEFGARRDAADRLRDLGLGARRLQQMLGGAVDPIFTPPWNRCADDVPGQLRHLGFAALSRDAGATAQTVLQEIAVQTDWSRQWRDAGAAGRDAATCIAADLARHAREGAAVGLMLHHAAMADDELAQLRRMLKRWTCHPNARWLPMHALITKALG